MFDAIILHLSGQDLSDQDLSVGRLVEMMGTSEKTLCRDVQRHLAKAGPAQVIQHLRLDHIRRALLKATPGTERVRDIANAAGYTAMSQFSALYTRRYNEPPSATLQRPPAGDPGPLGPHFTRGRDPIVCPASPLDDRGLASSPDPATDPDVTSKADQIKMTIYFLETQDEKCYEHALDFTISSVPVDAVLSQIFLVRDGGQVLLAMPWPEALTQFPITTPSRPAPHGCADSDCPDP